VRHLKHPDFVSSMRATHVVLLMPLNLIIITILVVEYKLFIASLCNIFNFCVASPLFSSAAFSQSQNLNTDTRSDKTHRVIPRPFAEWDVSIHTANEPQHT
jgi:hypothetical protein